MKNKFHTEAIVASGTIHGIKNALTPAVAFLDLHKCDPKGLESRVDPEKVMEVCRQSIRTAVHKLGQLIPANRWKATQDRCRVTADLIIEELGDQLGVIAVADNVDIEVRLGAGSNTFILTNPAEFREIVANLIVERNRRVTGNRWSAPSPDSTRKRRVSCHGCGQRARDES